MRIEYAFFRVFIGNGVAEVLILFVSMHIDSIDIEIDAIISIVIVVFIIYKIKREETV